MKVHINITIDEEVRDKLMQESNRSNLINDLLIGYFKAKEPMTLEQKERRVKELKARLAYEQAMEDIDHEYKQDKE